MKSTFVLCLIVLLVGTALAQGGRGRRLVPRGASPNHLDVGLPNALLGGNSPLLIHLKDQGLFDKENGAGSSRSAASLLPSILKSIMANQYHDESPDFEDNDIPSNPAMNNPQMMIRSLVDEEKLPDLEDLEEIVNDDELAKDLFASEKSEDKIHFYFKLRDALKNAYSKENEAESRQGSKGLRSQAGRDGGVRFNLEDLETQLKEKFPAAKNIDLGSGEVNEQEILVSLVELLKEYVAEETESHSKPQPVVETEEAAEVDADTANSKILEQLQRSDVSVNQVDSTGGIFFTLGEGQGGAEVEAEAEATTTEV